MMALAEKQTRVAAELDAERAAMARADEERKVTQEIELRIKIEQQAQAEASARVALK